MAKTALGTLGALLLLGGCADILGLNDFQAGDAGTAGSGTTSSSTTIHTGGSGGATTTSSMTGGSGGATTTSSSSAGGSGSATTSSMTGGSGGGALCTPNEVRACAYGGPVGTEGVGLCKAATQTCATDGMSFGACSGEVTPKLELCSTLGVDENCDGLAACSGAYRWAKMVGDPAGQFASAVAIDAEGNVIVVGNFGGTVSFGGTMHTAVGLDAFVWKLDRQGKTLWSKALGGANDENALAVALSPTGSIVVAGTTKGALDLGGGMLTGKGGNDIFLVALDPAGNHVWSKLFGGSGGDLPTSMAVDPSGSVVLAGHHTNGIVDDICSISANNQDAFVAKLSLTNGACAWVKGYGGSGADRTESVAIDSGGNVLVTGSFTTSVNLGGATFTSVGSSDGFIGKLDPNGAHIWSKALGAAGAQVGTGIAVDQNDNVVVVGNGPGGFPLGGASIGTANIPGAFVVKYDPSGAHQWSRWLGDAAIIPSVAADGQGAVVIAAMLNTGTITFGGASFTNALAANDWVVGKLAPDGSHLWSRKYGDTLGQSIGGVAVGATGEIAVVGGNAGTIDFGGGPLVNPSANSFNDVVVVLLAP